MSLLQVEFLISAIMSPADLEDDSSQLEEVKQLFSDITLPLKVDKLTKVMVLACAYVVKDRV